MTDSSASEGTSRFSPDLFDLDKAQEPTASLSERLRADIDTFGTATPNDPEREKAIGTTMFDVPGSEDNTITVLLPQHLAQNAPSQSLVRIKSRSDGRNYLGIVTGGPFSEPDSLRGDSHMLITVATRGAEYQPPFHGRVNVLILGEELADHTLCPPRLRPLPNSLVFPLSDEEASHVLKTAGDIRLGVVVGYKNVTVGIPSEKKSVLPRHTAVLGTTGGGKSTTIARLVQQAQAANMSVILLDVEGEYTHLHEPTTNKQMLSTLNERELEAAGIPADRMTLYHLVGRATSNPKHPARSAFSLQFDRLSPYAVAEILDLTEPQQIRFMRAYDIAKELMREMGIFPAPDNKADERIAMEIDEFERGYPCLTLRLIMDVVAACMKVADIPKKDERAKDAENKVVFTLNDRRLASSRAVEVLRKRIYAGPRPEGAVSWGALLGRLGRLNRLGVFDVHGATPLNFEEMLSPGLVSVVDLSDTGVSEMNNIVISDLLHGIQEAQDTAYLEYENATRENRSAKCEREL